MSANQPPAGICKCGHFENDHMSGDNDHICKSIGCYCGGFQAPTSAAGDRQNSDQQQQQQQISGSTDNDEQKFAHLFAAANEKIDKLTSDANQKKD
jgi:hypothetical protein